MIQLLHVSSCRLYCPARHLRCLLAAGAGRCMRLLASWASSSSLPVYDATCPLVMFALLQGVSGIVRPGQLTCLMGASGAGKTTLLDVVAGRKTQGIIEVGGGAGRWRQDLLCLLCWIGGAARSP